MNIVVHTTLYFMIKIKNWMLCSYQFSIIALIFNKFRLRFHVYFHSYIFSMLVFFCVEVRMSTYLLKRCRDRELTSCRSWTNSSIYWLLCLQKCNSLMSDTEESVHFSWKLRNNTCTIQLAQKRVQRLFV